MKTFEVLPLSGIDDVRLGASREETLSVLGQPEATFLKTPTSKHKTDAWFQSGFQVFYEGDTPTVCYIELSRDSGFNAMLFGLPVFSTQALLLVSEIERHATLDHDDPELGCSFVFPMLELSLWRPDDEEGYFSTVGVGVPGYYSGAT